MDLLENKTDKELLQSILAEIAKTQNEIRCAKADVQKAQSRLSFLIVAINEMLNRTGD